MGDAVLASIPAMGASGQRFCMPPVLKKRREFVRVQTTGKRFRTPTLLVLVAAGPVADAARVGYTVSRKVGGATIRNRVRRRLKEIVRTHPGTLCNGFDYVLIATPRAQQASFAVLEEHLLSALEKSRRWIGSNTSCSR